MALKHAILSALVGLLLLAVVAPATIVQAFPIKLYECEPYSTHSFCADNNCFTCPPSGPECCWWCFPIQVRDCILTHHEEDVCDWQHFPCGDGKSGECDEEGVCVWTSMPYCGDFSTCVN